MYPIDNLRLAVETAKRVLAKEKIDRQRNSDSIDKLTSLVSKMNMKMDKQDTQYKPQVYQGRRRGQNRHEYRQNNYQPRNGSYSRDRNSSYRGRGNFDRNYRSNYRGRPLDSYRHDDRQDNYR